MLIYEKRKDAHAMKNAALLIIDMQFGPLWGTYKKEETTKVIKELILKARNINIPIFYTQHEEPSGGFLVRGSQFWQIEKDVSPLSGDVIIHKQGTDAFYQTTLKNNLQAHGINHLVVAGVRTEYCIDTTCRSAIFQGFDVTLVEDGHTTVDSFFICKFDHSTS
jgi:nicotinamidase-related amidase